MSIVIATSSSWDAAVLTSCAAVLLALLIGAIRISIRPQQFDRYRSLGCAIAKLFTWRNSTQNDEVGLIVQTTMQKQKVQNVVTIYQVMGFVVIPPTIVVVVNIATGQVRANSPFQDVIQILVSGLLAVVQILPSIVSWRTIDCLYCFFFLSMAVWVSPFGCKPELLFETTLSANLMVIALIIARRATIQSALLSSVYAASFAATIWTHGAGPFWTPFGTIFSQVMVLLVLIVSARLLDVSCEESIRRGLEIEAAKETLAAASALLRSCTDVVVELDPEGAILGNAENLSSFLLQGPKRCLHGRKLTEMMPYEEDQLSFSEQLSAEEPGERAEVRDGLAEALHVRMRDGNGNILRLLLMWFRFRKLDGRPRYMVGIREFADPMADRVPRLASRSHGEEHIVPRDVEGGAILPEGSSVASSVRDEVQAVVVVDCSLPGFPLRACSTGFRMRVGSVARGTRFTDLMKHSSAFVGWVQRALNVILLEDEDAAPACGIILDMPHGKLRAVCRFLRENSGGSTSGEGSEEPADSPIDIKNVRFLLQNVRPAGSSMASSDGGGRPGGLQRGTHPKHVNL